ncbi:Cytochrome p450 [Thalictrum thalictroides]|uniref:Cytochrome p450 n=1 Tax=Thalictrum thalictroides TaxID=46969 RepID=A0A7J6XDS6_THATH|nr:Cytochrome p450 [Thalictrum thalictroides]
MLRKVSVTELLSNKRIESLYGIRQREGCKLVQTIESLVGIPIAIHDYVNATLFDILSGMLWSGSLVEGAQKQIKSDFRMFSQKLVDLCGEPNISDVFPFLAMFDLQRKGNKMKKLVLWFDKIFDQVIEKRLQMKTVENMDFLQVLLQCRDQVDQKKTPLTITHIKALLQDMMLAGTKTSSTTLEWAFAELMQKPHLMKKAQDELDQVVGLDNILEESHLPKLPYINAIVKETLRLHPAAPLLVPRRPSESCVIGGFLVPKGTKILINAWAIQRDPEYWDNPLEFRPERYMDSTNDCDYRGTNFSFIPFGSGRRVCVGVPLAEKMIPYLLAKLLHSFNWKMEEGAKLDMSEAFGLELVKKVPLVVIPISR